MNLTNKHSFMSFQKLYLQMISHAWTLSVRDSIFARPSANVIFENLYMKALFLNFLFSKVTLQNLWFYSAAFIKQKFACGWLNAWMDNSPLESQPKIICIMCFYK